MTYSKFALALSVTLFSSTLVFAQTAKSKKSQTTTTEATTQTPATTTTTDAYGNTTQSTTADPAATDTTRTQTTTTEETEAKDKDENKGGLFIEPMLTYEQGEVELTYPSPFGSSTEDLDGPGIGLRFGGHVYEALFLAVDGRYSKSKYKSSALNGEADAASYNAGVTLGVQTPVAGLRVWGTYILGGELDPEKIGSVDGKYEDMKGYRVGLGLYVKVVSINLEYQNTEFDKVLVNDGTTDYSDFIDPKQKSYILSVSFPIAL